MAGRQVDPESLLNRAKEQEKEYDWLGASNTYDEVLILVPKDGYAALGEILEQQAYALHRAALQADDHQMFRERTRNAMELYGNAKKNHTISADSMSLARADRCDAMISYLGFWHSSEPSEKKMLLDQAWNLTKRALSALGTSGKTAEFGKTFNLLSMSTALAFNYEWDFSTRDRMLKDALAIAEKAANSLSSQVDADELARIYVATAGFLSMLADGFVVSSEFARIDTKAFEYLEKARRLSEKILDSETPIGHLFPSPTSMSREEYMTLQHSAVDFGRRTKDRLITGFALEGLLQEAFNQALRAEDSDVREALLQKMLQYTEEAKQEFDIIVFTSPRFVDIWTTAPSAGYYMVLSYLESDRQKKHAIAEKARELCEVQLGLAKTSRIPESVLHAECDLQLALTDLARTETGIERKRTLLEQAMEHHHQSLEMSDRIYLPNSYERVWLQGWSSETESELAYVEEDVEKKIRLYREVVLRKKAGADLLADTAPQNAWSIGLWQYECGTCSLRLFSLTNENDWRGKALEAFERAAGWFDRADLPSRTAESHWEAGKVLDILGEHEKSSERFLLASSQFRKAGEKITRLADFYRDHASYMEAWSEIEKARYHHAEQNPASAKEHYNMAAGLLESTGKWSFLSTNYFAWAQVENAEDLSQRERCKDSIDAFGEAARLFTDSESKMHEHSNKIESTEEKQMVEMLIDAADRRQELCKARIALEEARLLDKEGRLGDASEKYGHVADMFAKIKQELSTDQDQKEIELIITLSKAWKAMAKAEAKSSPELYEEAARLFGEAKNLSPGDKAVNLAMGHSRLCMALGAGARYADTSDSALHAAAAQNLESAAKYYLKADLQSAADYAKASKLLFDSYAYVNRASSEEDQEKKTKLYTMAEKVLQASVSSYEKAGQPGRKEQVLKILAKVKEDRELAMSLAEVFLAPDIVSTTMAFSSPAPTHETAVGLDRFEHADVQATMIAKPKELHVGQELSLEIELVNAGRGPAQLTKVEGTVPKGFVIVQEPEKYRMEDSQINLRGRRLDALKTEDVRLVLKSTAKGNFTLKPRIIYLDESGTFKSCEPVPIEVSVREMGISGWIKGT